MGWNGLIWRATNLVGGFWFWIIFNVTSVLDVKICPSCANSLYFVRKVDCNTSSCWFWDEVRAKFKDRRGRLNISWLLQCVYHQHLRTTLSTDASLWISCTLVMYIEYILMNLKKAISSLLIISNLRVTYIFSLLSILRLFRNCRRFQFPFISKCLYRSDSDWRITWSYSFLESLLNCERYCDSSIHF